MLGMFTGIQQVHVFALHFIHVAIVEPDADAHFRGVQFLEYKGDLVAAHSCARHPCPFTVLFLGGRGG